MSKLPLEGIRIADFTWWLAGPASTRVLANHGAQVIKIESNTRPQPRQSRSLPTRLVGKLPLSVSPSFNALNTSKMGFLVDLKHPKGVELVKRLIAVSDVVTDNMSGGAMERLGLGYQDLVKIKPDIIVMNIPMMGPGGPYSHFGAQGDQIAAAAGMWHLTGYPESHGTRPGTVFTDWSTVPYHASTALLAALHYRNRTGKGQHVIVSQYEAAVNATGTAILDYTTNGRIQTRTGNRSPYGAPHGVYRCQGNDRWCAIVALTDEEWQGLCRGMGDPQWSRDSKFSTVLGRMEHVDELDRLIEEWTSDKPPEGVMALLQAEGVAAGIVQNSEDLLDNDPQLRERGHYVYLDHPEGRRMVYGADAFRFSATPGGVKRHAPLLGEHNHHVCCEILGMSEEEFTEYQSDGVFQ